MTIHRASSVVRRPAKAVAVVVRADPGMLAAQGFGLVLLVTVLLGLLGQAGWLPTT